MKKSNSQITHESEVQRQYVRVQLPGNAIIDGKTYPVRDLSNGGVSLDNVVKEYKKGEIFELQLLLPFEKFSMALDLKAQVEYYDKKEKNLGCEFVELKDSQVSILNSLIKSYVSGNIVSEGDIIDIVARNNFAKIRKNNDGEIPLSKADIAKRILPFLLLVVCGLLAATFLIGNVFEKISVVKSYQGVVQSEQFVVRAQADGLFQALIDPDVKRVSKGQDVATLQSRVLLPFTQSGEEPTPSSEDGYIIRTDTVKSPCDCFVVYQYVQNGEFRSLGEPLFKFIPVSAEPWVTVNLDPKDAYRVGIHNDVKLSIAGGESIVKGLVLSVDTKEADVSVSVVKVQTNRVLPIDLIGRPVYAEFFVY